MPRLRKDSEHRRDEKQSGDGKATGRVAPNGRRNGSAPRRGRPPGAKTKSKASETESIVFWLQVNAYMLSGRNVDFQSFVKTIEEGYRG